MVEVRKDRQRKTELSDHNSKLASDSEVKIPLPFHFSLFKTLKTGESTNFITLPKASPWVKLKTIHYITRN